MARWLACCGPSPATGIWSRRRPFRAKTPVVDYAAVAPWIAAQRAGEAAALAPGRTRCYEPTSGSSGATKLNGVAGPRQAKGVGHFTRAKGLGKWNGTGPSGVCSGFWTAVRS